MKCIPYGPSALLLQFADKLGDVTFTKGRAIVAELEARPPPGLIEFIPAFTTVLLEFDPRVTPNPLLTAPQIVKQLEKATRWRLPRPQMKEIPVTYDGPDLERVATLHRLSVREVRKLHTARVYKVYLLGFAPGFPYLGDLDPRLHTPRLATPRTRVPAGSVAIGGEHTGVYSVETPGGWNIIGHTRIKLFDPERAQSTDDAASMFWLRPGDRVRFVASET